MQAFEKYIKAAAGKIKLRSNEKRELRERLLSYMEYHPLPQTLQHTALVSQRPLRFHIAAWQWRSFASVAFALAIVIIPAAAEYTVPGDVLYPVKVRVNEEVLSQLSLGSYERMEWEARRVERRLAEARLLAREGRLTDEVEAEISETVKEHAASAERELAMLREQDADEAEVAQIVLETTLDVQSAMLATERASSTEGVLATAVADAKATIVAQQAPQSASRASYERFLIRTEESIAEAHKHLASIETSLTTEEQDDISRRITDIAAHITEAEELAAAGSTKEAIETLKNAMSRSQRLIAFTTDIEVRNTVTLESLVPAEPTEEERTRALEALSDELSQQAGILSAQLPAIKDETVSATLATGLAELESYQAVVLLALAEDGDLDAAEAVIEPARTLIAELKALVDTLPDESDAESEAASTTPGEEE